MSRRALYDELSGFSDPRYTHDYDFALRAVVAHPNGVRLYLDDRSTRTLEDALERERALNESIRWLTSARVSFRRWRKARRVAH